MSAETFRNSIVILLVVSVFTIGGFLLNQHNETNTFIHKNCEANKKLAAIQKENLAEQKANKNITGRIVIRGLTQPQIEALIRKSEEHLLRQTVIAEQIASNTCN